MPAPVAHAAVGAALYFALPRRFLPQAKSGRRFFLGICILLAILPDLDFVPGFLTGRPNHYHQGISHSLLVCGLLGAVVAWGLVRHGEKMLAGRPFWPMLLCFVLALVSHPVMDAFALDTKEPFGVPLFWPITEAHFTAPWPFFWDIRRSGGSNAVFLQSLASAHNLRALLRELVFGVTLLSVVVTFRLRERPVYLFAVVLAALCGALLLWLQPVSCS